jgi:hypothetical protein
MRKWIVLLVTALLALVVMPASARTETAPDLARYFPAKTAVFITFRTDPAFLDEVDAQLAKLPLAQLIPPGQPTTVRGVLDAALATENTGLSEVFAWLGDDVAYGFWPKPGQPDSQISDNWMIVAQVRDRAAAEAYLEKIAPDTLVKQTVGDYTQIGVPGGDGVFFLNDEALFLLPANPEEVTPPAPPDPPLNSAASFVSAVNALPAASYNALLYLLPGVIPQTDEQAALLFKDAGALLIGLTVLDNSVLTIDSVQLRGKSGDPAPAPAVDLAFAQYIPSNASAVIQGTDLNNLYGNLLNLILQTSQDTTTDPADQLSMGLRMMGLDLQKDLLNWMTGDFALFMRTDALAILNGALNGQVDLTGKLDFGLVFEATDPAAAQGLATKLDLLLKQAATNGQGVSVSNDTIGGTPVTLLQVDIPATSGLSLSLELALGANDHIFFVATRSAAQTILTGDGILSRDPTFTAAQAYFLPNTSTVWYTNGEGAVGTVGGMGLTTGFMLVGPAIGNVFNNIVTELDGAGSTHATPTPRPTLSPAEQVFGAGMTAERVNGLVADLIAAVNHASITSTVTADGVSQVRMVLQLQGE